MLGYTFGTGFGIGEVIGGKLNLGNNCCVETFCLPAPDDHGAMIEDFVAIRAITREYRRLAADAPADITPKDICAIADGTMPGDREAAMESFRLFGAAAGDAMATAVTLTDSIIVVGGGLTGAARHFMPALLESLRSSVRTINGEQVDASRCRSSISTTTRSLHASSKARRVKSKSTARTKRLHTTR